MFRVISLCSLNKRVLPGVYSGFMCSSDLMLRNEKSMSWHHHW